MSREQIKILLINLGKKIGLRIFSKLAIEFGEKIAIKVSSSFFYIFPVIGELINGVIGNLIDIPIFNKTFKETKEEMINLLSQSPHEATRRIVADYNDAINYFGRRGDININYNNYNIPNENINDINFELLNNSDELLIPLINPQENNNV